MWNELIPALAGGLIGTIVTLVIALIKNAGERRQEWWERYKWAVEAYGSEKESERLAASHLLISLGHDPIARTTDKEMINALLREYALTGLTSTREDDGQDDVNEGNPTGSPERDDSRVRDSI